MIREDLVFVKQPLQSRKAVIEFIAAAAIKAGVLKDAAVFCDAVFRRENEISTSIGHGIAIPHGKTDAVHEAFIAYVSTATAFEWDAETKDQVQVILVGKLLPLERQKMLPKIKNQLQGSICLEQKKFLCH